MPELLGHDWSPPPNTTPTFYSPTRVAFPDAPPDHGTLPLKSLQCPPVAHALAPCQALQ